MVALGPTPCSRFVTDLLQLTLKGGHVPNWVRAQKMREYKLVVLGRYVILHVERVVHVVCRVRASLATTRPSSAKEHLFDEAYETVLGVFGAAVVWASLP